MCLWGRGEGEEGVKVKVDASLYIEIFISRRLGKLSRVINGAREKGGLD